MTLNIGLGEIIRLLPELAPRHARTSRTYALLEKVVDHAVKGSRFALAEGAHENLGDFGRIELPYHRMGAVDSLHLFGLDELIIFAFYLANRERYRLAADIGANLGLHSVLMEKCGWQVKAYEPDPVHAALLRRNLALNGSAKVELVEAAVSDRAGTLDFVRVLGNTTSSHLAGTKPKAYGELESFPVAVISIGEILADVDFVKMDAEGHESTILLGSKAEHWKKVEMMVEVGSEKNAQEIYDHLKKLGVSAFAQKTGWSRVRAAADMPTSYKHGSLFITGKSEMPW